MCAMSTWCPQGSEEGSGFPETEITGGGTPPPPVWLLGIKVRSSARTASKCSKACSVDKDWEGSAVGSCLEV